MVGPLALAAQSSCNNDPNAQGLLDYGMRVGTGTSRGMQMSRDSLGIPAASAEEIHLVTDPEICAALGKVFGDIVGDSTVSGKVIAVRVGSVYIVEAPAFSYKIGGKTYGMVIDSATYRWKCSYVS